MQDNPTTAAVYQDPEQPLPLRVDDLVARLTLQEKIDQLFYAAPAVPRVGIPAYNWWGEALHGVARAGVATVFPQAIALAATFNPPRVHEVATAIADEARAKHHEFARHDDRGIYKGLTAWSPNVNIYRDPRWGRGHETYGEDPFLTARMGVAFVTGLQGDHPTYLKVVATPKHFAVHSGPERNRSSFDASVSLKDLHETYLPAFRACVVEGHAASVMTAYNRLFGEPCSASTLLLQTLLREAWGFAGCVVSDCGAIENIYEAHRATASHAESIALTVSRGCDLACGAMVPYLHEAVARGLIDEATIDAAVKRVFALRFRLGLFDPQERVPYAAIPYELNDCAAHRELARALVRESCVLLKNADRTLPLARTLRTIAVIGPNADDRDVLLGNYNGTSSHTTTILDGIREAVSPVTRVLYARGCPLFSPPQENRWSDPATHGFTEAVSAAERADVAIVCLGLSAQLEGENGDAYNSEAGGDRLDLGLPPVQQALLERVVATGTPVVLVLVNGGPLSIPWAHEHVHAILETWYAGAEAGNGVADLLFGDYSPCGRLPVTVVNSVDDLPPFEDYAMRNRTYRYSERTPLYPFGYGLSYSPFSYRDLEVAPANARPGEAVTARVRVTNTGAMRAAEAVQCYLQGVQTSVRAPRWQLRGVRTICLEPGSSADLEFTLASDDLALVDDGGRPVLEPGEFRVYVGGSQPDARSRELTGTDVIWASFTISEG